MGLIRESTVVNSLNLIPSIQRLSNSNINQQLKTPLLLMCECICWSNGPKKFSRCFNFHIIYSVGINPDTLVLITYDSLNNRGKLKYFDILKLAYVEITLNENLIRDILLFKEIMREIKS